MKLTDELEALDDKINANQVQYNLGKEAAKTSALSSKDLLEKYVVKIQDTDQVRSKKTKFEYSPLGMSLIKSF